MTSSHMVLSGVGRAKHQQVEAETCNSSSDRASKDPDLPH